MNDKKVVHIPEEVSVRALAGILEVDPTALISKLVAGGVMATINQNLDYDTAVLVAEEFGVHAEAIANVPSINKTSESKNAVHRAPIVTIMGHVDHGKTSLLDYIRNSNVAKHESGGITQHISAYQIDFKGKHGAKKITFIDTPGHEAFSALREHGAGITDIVILVIAADDGVKPQTIETIEHTKKTNVPVIVAINKIDAPGANTERVKQQLAEHELVPEDWGGKTVIVPISAKTGEGVDHLLDMVVLTADMQELKADPDGSPEAIVIEAKLDKQVGPVATILVFNGTIRTGQVLVVGTTYGRIRAMEDDVGVSIAQAGPSKPTRIIGLKDVPKFGERVEVVPNEKVARTMTQTGTGTKSAQGDTERNSLKIIIKADVGGSLAALEETIKKLTYKDASVEIVGSGIGSVNENDINLAKASKARVMAFRVPVNKRIAEIASKEGVDLNEYWVIYELSELLEKELKFIATTTYVNVQLGRVKLLAVFLWSKSAGIVGGEVLDGVIRPNVNVEIYRDKELIGTAKTGALKVGKLEVDRVEKGTQCGISLSEATVNPEIGDILNFFETKEEK